MRTIKTYCLMLLILLAGCEYFQREGAAPERKAVARVGEEFLYLDEIRDLGLKGAAREDSLRIVDAYIENWVQDKLKLQYAYDNLPAEELDVESQVQDYRESLIVYNYETAFIRQHLDTTVDEEELKNYYLENKNNFKLQDDIVRLLYVKIPVGAPNEDSLRIWLKVHDEKMKEKLMAYANLHAMDYNLNDSIWLDRMLVKRKISSALASKYEESKARLIEIRDTSFTIFARIVEYRTAESEAPFSYVRRDINRMIINRRKLNLARKLTDDIMQSAAREKKFEIYK